MWKVLVQGEAQQLAPEAKPDPDSAELAGEEPLSAKRTAAPVKR